MEVTARELLHSLDEGVALSLSASAQTLAAVAEWDARELWKDDGATSMSSWLAARHALAWGTAREWVRVARALTELPAIAEAYAAGRLSWDQLRFLTKFATAETDALWALDAPAWSPAALYREALRHQRVRATDVADARAMRSLYLSWDEDMRLLYLEGRLPAEQGAAVQAALEARAQDVVLADAPDAPADARMADALVELVTDAGSGGGREVLVVHADAGILAGEASAGEDLSPSLAETESGVRLSSDAVRRIACDAKVEWVLESEGRPVGVGRRSRHIPPWLMRLLRHRDLGTCRFPGCERRRWLKAHHLVHWADGGATDLDNLVLLCHAHHRLLHEDGWRTSGHPVNLRFHDPGGRPLRSFAESLGRELALST